jgi:hypothetical protein
MGRAGQDVQPIGHPLDRHPSAQDSGREGGVRPTSVESHRPGNGSHPTGVTTGNGGVC